MRAELRDPLENIYPDSTVADPPRLSFTADVARGGIASVHILVKGCEPGGEVAFELLEGGRPVRGASWYVLRDVPVEENTGLTGFTEGSMKGAEPPNSPNPYVVRRAPFRTYDAMEPAPAGSAAASDTVALRCEMAVPRGAKPGTRIFEIRVRSGDFLERLRWKTVIHPATIPPAGKMTFPVTNWFSYENVAGRHGLVMWSDGYWDMLEKYARLMARGRQNVFWIPLQVVFEMRDGKPVLNRDRLKRIVRIFTKAGLWYIEGGHVAGRTGGKWEATTFDFALAPVLATSPEGHRHIVAVCSQLMEEIRNNGWQGRWIQHATDEPTAGNAADYRILVGMIRKYMPGIPILDATMEPTLVGSVDIWCPQVQEYQKHRETFEEQRSFGDRVWFYTCCFPGGPWLNRLLDQELVRPALFGWAAALFRLDGFLHWGLNQYREDQNPFLKSVIGNWGGGGSSLPAGDTHVIYPGAGGPWSGLRFESQREGWEDCELLNRLRERNARAAERIARKAIRGFDDYVRNAADFRRARRALLEACS